MIFNYLGLSFGFAIISLLTFGILQWLHIPAGSLVDWVIGIASFEWLLVIVTIPWNVHFEAKEVIAEARISEQKKIPVDKKQIQYAGKVSRIALIVAIALHLSSALGLYGLAVSGISAVGYISSGATLLLTLLRPAIRGYQYLAHRLAMIRQQIKYPREDVLELRGRVATMETNVNRLLKEINLNNPHSLVAKQKQEWDATRQKLAALQATFEQHQADNEVAHQRLSQEAKSAIAQLTEDSQFLEQVREIIRFFKTA